MSIKSFFIRLGDRYKNLSLEQNAFYQKVLAPVISANLVAIPVVFVSSEVSVSERIFRLVALAIILFGLDLYSRHLCTREKQLNNKE